MKEIVVPSRTIFWCEQALASGSESVVDIAPLRVEASHRCFYRITTTQRTVILMDSPPALERNELFAKLGEVFHRHGVPVAEILASDEEQGLFLLTDLGDVHFETLYGTEVQDAALRTAIDLLPLLGGIEHPAIEPYTAERMYMELDIFAEWFVGELLNLEVYTGVYHNVSERLVALIDEQPKCCVHRDYHCRNLLFNNGKLGVVDFQDALQGPILYDVASLLHDCYHTLADSEIERWLHYFVSITPALDGFPPSQVQQWFHWTAMQRQLKAIGIFTRMHLRDGKSTHLRYILPLLQRLQRHVQQYPELRDLNMQLNSCIKAAPSVVAGLQ